MPAPAPIVGIDFGTSNSVVALPDPTGRPRLAEFTLLGRQTSSFRSLLFFDLDEQRPNHPIEYTAGPEGIEAYLEAFGDGRLIQSFKTHLTSESLGRTALGPHAIDLDGLLVLFLRRLRERGEASLGQALSRAVFGRPVEFAGARHADTNARAEARLRSAAAEAGFAEVHVELEPIAAAYHYEAQLERDELALIADFGAGTTDFCVMRIGPSRRAAHDRSEDVLGTRGIGVAGDDLDAALIEHVVAPRLGKGSHYREFGKTLAIPASYYHKLSHWHQLSFLRSAQTQRELERLHRHADEPEAIAALMTIIEDNQGFHLHEAVEATKIALSAGDRAEFRYRCDDFEVVAEVTRAQFEGWIAEHVAAIASCLDASLEQVGLMPRDIDRVFMTGGTAFVPAVRREFAERFGAGKLSRGDELSSIAAGLAARGRRLAGCDVPPRPA
jgi:hypothetical chaperone protein